LKGFELAGEEGSISGTISRGKKLRLSLSREKRKSDLYQENRKSPRVAHLVKQRKADGILGKGKHDLNIL